MTDKPKKVKWANAHWAKDDSYVDVKTDKDCVYRFSKPVNGCMVSAFNNAVEDIIAEYATLGGVDPSPNFHVGAFVIQFKGVERII